MIWIVLLIAGLAGLAHGWIVVRTGTERITISFELVKFTADFRKAKDAAIAVLQRGYRSRTGGP
jgi:hypothetical protein